MFVELGYLQLDIWNEIWMQWQEFLINKLTTLQINKNLRFCQLSTFFSTPGKVNPFRTFYVNFDVKYSEVTGVTNAFFQRPHFKPYFDLAYVPLSAKYIPIDFTII